MLFFFFFGKRSSNISFIFLINNGQVQRILRVTIKFNEKFLNGKLNLMIEKGEYFNCFFFFLFS